MKSLLITCLAVLTFSIHAQVSTGRILTEGVTITAEDGSFTLSSEDEYWDVPFICKNDLKIFAHYPQRPKLNEKLTNNYERALKNGAKKVKVKVPGFENDFFGILAINDIPKGMLSCVRVYQIRVPASYAQQALNGRTSVVYEYFHPKCKNKDGLVMTRPWVLWLSDVPF